MKPKYLPSGASMGAGQSRQIERMVLYRDRSDGSQAVADIGVYVPVGAYDTYVRVKWGMRKAKYPLRPDDLFKVPTDQATSVHERRKVFMFWVIRHRHWEPVSHQRGLAISMAYADRLREQNFWMAAYARQGVWLTVKDSWRIPNSHKSKELREKDLLEKHAWAFE